MVRADAVDNLHADRKLHHQTQISDWEIWHMEKIAHHSCTSPNEHGGADLLWSAFTFSRVGMYNTQEEI